MRIVPGLFRAAWTVIFPGKSVIFSIHSTCAGIAHVDDYLGSIWSVMLYGKSAIQNFHLGKVCSESNAAMLVSIYVVMLMPPQRGEFYVQIILSQPAIIILAVDRTFQSDAM
jgi:hypothetical protein